MLVSYEFKSKIPSDFSNFLFYTLASSSDFDCGLVLERSYTVGAADDRGNQKLQAREPKQLPDT